MNQRLDILEKESQIREWIANHESIAFMAKQLECKVDTLKRYFKKMNIEYQGNQGGKGKKNMINQYMPAMEYMKSDTMKCCVLKDKLIREGLKQHQCECCKSTTWLGRPIPLEVHHKDGHHYHNVMDNIELLCPNCHALKHQSK